MAEPILLKKFVKQPAEKFAFAVEFSGRIPAGLTIATCSVVASVNGETASGIIEGSPVIDETRVSAKIKGGTNGVTYKLTYTIVMSDSFTTLEEDILMEVIDR